MLIAQRPTLSEETVDEYRSRFVIEPLEPGFGYTLGNSLRRTLLSSIPGASVTSIKIDNVLHEFSTVEGVKEDVPEVILNLKALVVSSEHDEPVTMYLRKSGAGDVTAADIAPPAGVEVHNPDLKIATLSDKGKLEMELVVERGRGYVSAVQNKGADNEIGRMPVDSIYSPVLKVTYKVEATRVEQRTDFDKLVIDVETKPSIRPRDALASAGKTLVELFGLARELNVEAEGIDIGPSPVDEQLAADLALPVEDLQPLVEIDTQPVDRARLLGQRLVLPALRHGAQQRDEGGGGGEHDLAGRGVLEQCGVGLERGGEERLGRHEEHHELRCSLQRLPVGLRPELVDVGAHLAGVPGEVVVALGVVGGRGRVEERVERHLRVDHDVAAPGQVHDQVGALGAVVEAHLLGEVAAVHQPGQLDGAAQVQLAPAAAHLRAAQRGRQLVGLAAQAVGRAAYVVDLLVQLALPGDPGVLEVAQGVVETVEPLEHLGVPRLAAGAGPQGGTAQDTEGQAERETEAEADEQHQQQREGGGEAHVTRVTASTDSRLPTRGSGEVEPVRQPSADRGEAVVVHDTDRVVETGPADRARLLGHRDAGREAVPAQRDVVGPAAVSA